MPLNISVHNSSCAIYDSGSNYYTAVPTGSNTVSLRLRLVVNDLILGQEVDIGLISSISISNDPLFSTSQTITYTNIYNTVGQVVKTTVNPNDFGTSSSPSPNTATSSDYKNDFQFDNWILGTVGGQTKVYFTLTITIDGESESYPLSSVPGSFDIFWQSKQPITPGKPVANTLANDYTGSKTTWSFSASNGNFTTNTGSIRYLADIIETRTKYGGELLPLAPKKSGDTISVAQSDCDVNGDGVSTEEWIKTPQSINTTGKSFKNTDVITTTISEPDIAMVASINIESQESVYSNTAVIIESFVYSIHEGVESKTITSINNNVETTNSYNGNSLNIVLRDIPISEFINNSGTVELYANMHTHQDATELEKTLISIYYTSDSTNASYLLGNFMIPLASSASGYTLGVRSYLSQSASGFNFGCSDIGFATGRFALNTDAGDCKTDDISVNSFPVLSVTDWNNQIGSGKNWQLTSGDIDNIVVNDDKNAILRSPLQIGDSSFGKSIGITVDWGNGSNADFVDIISVSAGYTHTLALKNDGTVWACGYNAQGQLGNGTTVSSTTPIMIEGFSDVKSISAGYYHSVALKNDGTVWSWGYNTYGQLGNGSTTNSSVPIQVTGLTGVIDKISCNGHHSLALKNDGTVWAWGYNYNGQIGDGTKVNKLTPVSVSSNISDIAAGSSSNFLLKNDGTVLSCGQNTSGQLGDGTITSRSTFAAVSVLTGVSSIYAGSMHAAAVLNDGTVWSWGYNYYGQLGNNSTSNSKVPIQTNILTDVSSVSMGFYHTVAVNNSGEVWSWGRNINGELGNGTRIDSSVPIQVTSLTGVSSISAGSQYALALKSDGTVWAWGVNPYGAFGTGNIDSSIIPVQVGTNIITTTNNVTDTYNLALTSSWDRYSLPIAPTEAPIDLTDMVSVVTGQYHTVALKNDGTVWAWGLNYNGQLGNNTVLSSKAPLQVEGLTGISAISSRANNTIALRGSDGTVWAWGRNFYGELGNGTNIESHFPVQVIGLTGVTSISAGPLHTVALKSNGTVWAWGHNWVGELGNGTTTNSTVPVQVTGLNNVLSICTGEYFTLALKSDGTVWAWGHNSYGQLGNNSTTNSKVPVQVSGLTGVSAISAGSEHSVALKSNGTVYSWGNNYYGIAGNGTSSGKILTPVAATGLNSVNAITAAGSHTMAIKSNGDIVAWGYNIYGVFGNGTTSNSSTPVTIAGLTDFDILNTGYQHTAAIKNDGTVWAWGYNYYGQLGDGTTTNRTAPVQVNSQPVLTDNITVANITISNPSAQHVEFFVDCLQLERGISTATSWIRPNGSNKNILSINQATIENGLYDFNPAYDCKIYQERHIYNNIAADTASLLVIFDTINDAVMFTTTINSPQAVLSMYFQPVTSNKYSESVSICEIQSTKPTFSNRFNYTWKMEHNSGDFYVAISPVQSPTGTPGPPTYPEPMIQRCDTFSATETLNRTMPTIALIFKKEMNQFAGYQEISETPVYYWTEIILAQTSVDGLITSKTLLRKDLGSGELTCSFYLDCDMVGGTWLNFNIADEDIRARLEKPIYPSTYGIGYYLTTGVKSSQSTVNRFIYGDMVTVTLPIDGEIILRDCSLRALPPASPLENEDSVNIRHFVKQTPSSNSLKPLLGQVFLSGQCDDAGFLLQNNTGKPYKYYAQKITPYFDSFMNAFVPPSMIECKMRFNRELIPVSECSLQSGIDEIFSENHGLQTNDKISFWTTFTSSNGEITDGIPVWVTQKSNDIFSVRYNFDDTEYISPIATGDNAFYIVDGTTTPVIALLQDNNGVPGDLITNSTIIPSISASSPYNDLVQFDVSEFSADTLNYFNIDTGDLWICIGVPNRFEMCSSFSKTADIWEEVIVADIDPSVTVVSDMWIKVFAEYTTRHNNSKNGAAIQCRIMSQSLESTNDLIGLNTSNASNLSDDVIVDIMPPSITSISSLPVTIGQNIKLSITASEYTEEAITIAPPSDVSIQTLFGENSGVGIGTFTAAVTAVNGSSEESQPVFSTSVLTFSSSQSLQIAWMPSTNAVAYRVYINGTGIPGDYHLQSEETGTILILNHIVTDSGSYPPPQQSHVGSGLLAFRVNHSTVDGKYTYTDWLPWEKFIVAENTIEYELIYNNLYDMLYNEPTAGSRKISVQVIDRVGNLSESNPITVIIDNIAISDTGDPMGISEFASETGDSITLTKDSNLYIKTIDEYDKSTSVKDIRFKEITESTDDEWSAWLFYDALFPYTLSRQIDGTHRVEVQTRDYGNNTSIQHSLFEAIYDSSDRGILFTYAASTSNNIYLAGTKTQSFDGMSFLVMETNPYGDGYKGYYLTLSNIVTNLRAIDRTSDISISGQTYTFKYYTDDEPAGDYFYIDDTLGTLVFKGATLPADTISETIDIKREIGIIYTWDAVSIQRFIQFDYYNEPSVTSMFFYDNILYVGGYSGNIYTVNNYSILNIPVFTLEDADSGKTLPVTSIFVHQFLGESEPYIYATSAFAPRLFRAPASTASSGVGWERVADLNDLSDDISYGNNGILSATTAYNTIYLGTENGTVIKYQRYLDGETVITDTLFGTNIPINTLCTSGNNIFAGVGSNSEIWISSIKFVSLPENPATYITIPFNETELSDASPWNFYNDGSTLIDTGVVNYYAIPTEHTAKKTKYIKTLKSDTNKITIFRTGKNSLWSKSMTSILSWVFESEMICLAGSSESEKQGFRISDGHHTVDISISKNYVYLKSGDNFTKKQFTRVAPVNAFSDESVTALTESNSDNVKSGGYGFALSYDPGESIEDASNNLWNYPAQGIRKIWNFVPSTKENHGAPWQNRSLLEQYSSISGTTDTQGWIADQFVVSAVAGADPETNINPDSVLTVVPTQLGESRIIWINDTDTPININSATTILLRVRYGDGTTGNTSQLKSNKKLSNAKIKIALSPGKTMNWEEITWVEADMLQTIDYVTYKMKCSYCGDINSVAIQFDNLPEGIEIINSKNMRQNIYVDYVAVVDELDIIEPIDITNNLVPIRVVVTYTADYSNNNIKIYIGKTEYAFIDENDFLSAHTLNKEIIFGKLNIFNYEMDNTITDRTVVESGSTWGYGQFRFCPNSIESPVGRKETNFIKQCMLQSTGSPTHIVNYRNTAWAVTEGVVNTNTIQDPSMTHIKVFAFNPNTEVWEEKTSELSRYQCSLQKALVATPYKSQLVLAGY